jgi:hypothetical protein
MPSAPSVAELLDGHVSLDVECFDRLYLNCYVPTLQTSGGIAYFLRDHRGHPIASPALFGQMGRAFRDAMLQFATDNDIPVIRFKSGDRKIDVIRPYLARATQTGVVAIGIAQEYQSVTVGTDVRRDPATGCPHYSFRKVERRVTCYYLYIFDDDWGPCFIKLCAYFPYPGKLWCNGHEWVKRQLDKAGIAYEALANGFAWVEDPAALRRMCNRISPNKVRSLFERWMSVIPLPLTKQDRAAGYDWDLSMRQVEFSRTLVLDRPARARAFFEHVIQDNIGLGRPEQVEMIFDRRVQRNASGRFYTRVVTRGVEPRISIGFKHSWVKQYLKEGRAIRIETVVNNPKDMRIKRRLGHLGALGAVCRKVNRRILRVQRVASAPSMTRSLFERVTLPDGSAGRRTVALRYGDPRAMAVMAALTLCLHHVSGITNKSLRPLVATLLGVAYQAPQMTYDLWRLRRKGLIERVPGTHTYVLTVDGTRAAMFYTKTFASVIDPLFAAAASPRPSSRPAPDLRAALRTIDLAVSSRVEEANVAA